MCVLGRNEDILKKHFLSLNLSDYWNDGPQKMGSPCKELTVGEAKALAKAGLTLEKGSHTIPITSQSILQH